MTKYTIYQRVQLDATNFLMSGKWFTWWCRLGKNLRNGGTK